MASPPTKPGSLARYARYASDRAVAQYCEAHYGPERFGVANFPARVVRLCIDRLGSGPRRRALDLGCAVGRASFELAPHFDRVDGVDLSAGFIALARRLQARGRLRYRFPEEGDLLVEREVSLEALGLAAGSSRVVFSQGDAESLDGESHGYDLVLAANLIDRLAAPGRFLAGIHRRLVVGGLLAIASPYVWREEFTPRRRWLGGRFRAGKPLHSLQGLGEKLAGHFVAVGEPQEVEFVLGETARTCQHGRSQLTCWRRVR